MKNILGVIGGSGLYQLGVPTEKVTVETPYGTPSSPLHKAEIGNTTLYFIARHGEHHTILPSELNSRANIYALKKMGAKVVLSVSAVGSLREEIVPGDFVLPEQYLDLTKGRPNTFFGQGVAGHAHFADPACQSLRDKLAKMVTTIGVKAHVGGTYVCMEGPQFSTRAESHWYRGWEVGTSRRAVVIGMTAMPEAKLAREARLCYHTIAMATDYDCWKGDADVSVESIVKILKANVGNSQKLIQAIANEPPAPCGTCWHAMEHAVMTPKEHWPKDRAAALATILE